MRRRLSLVLLLLVSVLIAQLVLRGWVQREPAPAESADNEINYALDRFRATLFDAAGRRTAIIEGPRLEHSRVARRAKAQAPRFTIDPEREAWRGRADEGLLDRGNEHIELQGSVVVERDHPRGLIVIRTERLEYDHAARRLHAPAPARIEQGEKLLAGDTLTVWLDQERMELHENVHAIFDPGLAGGHCNHLGADTGCRTADQHSFDRQ
ncbi:MAG: hypothetical protein Kow0020_15550 [Wenzhouxiangellaceae bacterium]